MFREANVRIIPSTEIPKGIKSGALTIEVLFDGELF